MSYTKCKVITDAAGAPTGIIVMPRAKMIYPSLFTPVLPKGETNDEKKKHNITLLFPKEADLGPAAARMKEVRDANLTAAALKTAKFKNPFLRITQEDSPPTYHRLEAAGIDPSNFPVMLRAANKYKPTIRAADMSNVLDEEQTYDGRWCRVSVKFYWWKHETGGTGVSASLENVQLLENDTVLPRIGGSNADNEFEAVDVGGSADSVFA